MLNELIDKTRGVRINEAADNWIDQPVTVKIAFPGGDGLPEQRFVFVVDASVFETDEVEMKKHIEDGLIALCGPMVQLWDGNKESVKFTYEGLAD